MRGADALRAHVRQTHSTATPLRVGAPKVCDFPGIGHATSPNAGRREVRNCRTAGRLLPLVRGCNLTIVMNRHITNGAGHPGGANRSNFLFSARAVYRWAPFPASTNHCQRPELAPIRSSGHVRNSTSFVSPPNPHPRLRTGRTSEDYYESTWLATSDCSRSCRSLTGLCQRRRQWYRLHQRRERRRCASAA